MVAGTFCESKIKWHSSCIWILAANAPAITVVIRTPKPMCGMLHEGDSAGRAFQLYIDVAAHAPASARDMNSYTRFCGMFRERSVTVKVVPEEKTFGYQGAVTREAWRKANIVFVGDYVEAACHAYKHGLIQVLVVCVVLQQ